MGYGMTVGRRACRRVLRWVGLVVVISAFASLSSAVALGAVVLVSVPSGGGQPDSGSSRPSVSADGSRVAFESHATNLDAGDTNMSADEFIRDLNASQTVRADVLPSGGQPKSGSWFSSVAPGGRYVLFGGSWLGRLYVRDLTTATTHRVDISPSGAFFGGDQGRLGQQISANGRIVLFSGPGAPVGGIETREIYERNLATGVTKLVSVSSSGAPAKSWTDCASMSNDGQVVAFRSFATDLSTAPDTNRIADVFVHNLATHRTFRIDLTRSGGEVTGTSGCPAVSANGRYVAFSSFAPNLVAGDTDRTVDTFVRDLALHTTRRVSVSSTGAQGQRSPTHKESLGPVSISAGGCYVAFSSRMSGLVAGDTNDIRDVFVHSCVDRTTTRVSLTASDQQLTRPSKQPSISADGRYIAFTTPARLTSADQNAFPDVYLTGPLH